MLVIVGHKITVQQGDDFTFKIIIKNPRGEILKLNTNVIITMRICKRRESDIILSKVASPIYIDNELTHVFEFKSKDTINMNFGEYVYDVTLEINNKRYTVIPASNFSVKRSLNLTEPESESSDIILDNEDDNIMKNIISPVPLIGEFSFIEFNKNPIPDEEDLIIF